MLIRPAMTEDAPVIAEIIVEGDETFASFAPPGWERPLYERELEQAYERLTQPSRWAAVAESDGQVVGYADFIGAAELTRTPVDDPGLAHLGRLFVRPTHWGTGVAPALHAAAIREAKTRGFTHMRLYTPVGQVRARRFYEREGWRPLDEIPENELGLPLIEYRRSL